MEILLIALLAVGGIYLVSQTQLGEQGLQGTYVDGLGVVWDLAIVSDLYGARSTHWEAHPAPTGAQCKYMYTDGSCPQIKGSSKSDVESQIDALVTAYRKEKGI